MLLMIEEGIRGGMCQSIHRYGKANNKYMKNYDKKTESSYLTYLDANNLYGQAMSQKVPVNGFMWYNKYLSDFNEEFIKNYNGNSDVEYFLEVDIEHPKRLFSSQKELPFLKKLVFLKTCLQYRRQRKICHTHKGFKTSIKLLIKIKKGTQSN